MNADKNIFIGLGGNRKFSSRAVPDTLLDALKLLDADPAINVRARSGLWLSPAWPDPSDPEYVNAAAWLSSDLEPPALLERLHAIERRFGRRRDEEPRYASRTLDLDILDYGGIQRSSPRLTLPHPRLHERAFVIKPLLEIAPSWTHPRLGAGAALARAIAPADWAAVRRLRKETLAAARKP